MVLQSLYILLMLSAVLFLPTTGYAATSSGAFLSRLDSELGLNPINYNFAVQGDVIHFSELAYYNSSYYNSSPLYKLYNSINDKESLAEAAYTSHNSTLWLEYYNSSSTNKVGEYLSAVANDYEHSVNSSYSLSMSECSIHPVGGNGYKLVSYFNLVYKGVKSLSTIKVVLVINSSVVDMRVIDGLSLLHVVPFTPVNITANLTKLIEEKIDNGVQWQDVHIRPVLMTRGDSLVYVLQVEACYQQGGGSSLYLTAYFYPYNVSLINEKVTGGANQGIGVPGYNGNSGGVRAISYNGNSGGSLFLSTYNLFFLVVVIMFALIIVYNKKKVR